MAKPRDHAFWPAFIRELGGDSTENLRIQVKYMGTHETGFITDESHFLYGKVLRGILTYFLNYCGPKGMASCFCQNYFASCIGILRNHFFASIKILGLTIDRVTFFWIRFIIFFHFSFCQLTDFSF